MVGVILFVVFAVIVALLFLLLRKQKPRNIIDKTAWSPYEREAIDVLRKRLETGDITEETYRDKIKEITDLHS